MFPTEKSMYSVYRLKRINAENFSTVIAFELDNLITVYKCNTLVIIYSGFDKKKMIKECLQQSFLFQLWKNAHHN